MSRCWLGGLALGAVLVLLGLAIGIDRSQAGVRTHPGGQALELVIVRDDGEPLAAAEVLVLRGRELLRAGRVGEDGRVTLVAFSGPGSVAVRCSGEEVARRELAQGVGRVEIVVPSGASVGGVVRVDGVPRGGVGLLLSDGPAEGWSARVLRRAFERVGWRERRVERWTRSAEDGTFRFACLPADWSGALQLAYYERDSFRDGSRRLALAGPRSGLVFDLQASSLESTIRGRVVADGQPAPHASWRASVSGGRRALGHDGLGLCDELGRFTFPVTGELRWLRIEFLQPGVGFLVLEREEAALRGPVIELGDVELRPARAVPFRVTTDSGAPLAGARALPREESLLSELETAAWSGALGELEPDFLESQPTDAEGRGVLHGLTRDSHDFLVRADCFTPARVSFADGDPLPLEVTLVPWAALEVRLRDADGRVPPGLGVSVRSNEALFLAPATDAQAGAALPLPPLRPSSWRRSVDESGVARIEGLRAGIALDLAPVDEYQTVLEGLRGLTLAPGERRALELVVRAPPRTLVVSVHDSLGFPIRGAEITVSIPGSRSWRTTHADQAGMLRLPDYYGALVDLRIASELFRTRALGGVPVPPEGATVEVVLARDWWPW